MNYMGFNGYTTCSIDRSGEFAKSDSVNAGWIFSGKLERDFLEKVREGNQTEREKERAEVKVFRFNGILVILIIG